MTILRASILLTLSAVLAASAQAASLDEELLMNGDAETGTSMGWGIATAEVATRAFVDNASIQSDEEVGDFSFFGGSGSPTELVQTVDVSDLALDIDAGQTATFFHILLQSRRLGGLIDVASGTLSFLGATGTPLLIVEFEDPTAISGVYDWDPIDRVYMTPAGTRSIELALDFRRLNGGISTDAFADNASLVVVPEPAFASGLLVGLGCLAATGSRRAAPRRGENGRG